MPEAAPRVREAYDAAGQRVLLADQLGRGGEGEVYAIQGQPGTVAKLMLGHRRQGKHDKVRAMVEGPPAGAYDAIEGHPVLTWPRQPLYAHPTKHGEGTFLGYAMARIQTRDFVPFYQLTTAARRASLGGKPITFDRLVILAMRLCHVVRTLHRFGYAVGDLNDRNVLVSRRLTPLLMDTDSFQVPRASWGHHPCTVGDQLYWPPELLDVDLTKHTGSRESGDRYALGVLLFQLFMDGLRPYQSRGKAVDHLETLAEKTRAGHYPWAHPKHGVLEPPASAPDYDALPRPIRDAFERCFVAGHRKPAKRPSADDWYRALAQVRDAGFVQCTIQQRHVYGRGHAGCPWCADPNDPFDPRPARPAPSAKPVVRRVPAPVLPKVVKARTKGPPQRAMAPRPMLATKSQPATPPRTLVRPSAAPRPAPRARPARAAKTKPAKRAKPTHKKRAAARRSRWPAKARWLAALTTGLIAAWWVLP